ncbi:MAG: TonB-dependent receptor plug domain-containing protein [Gammaproteobacteria bacterium]
MKQKNIVKLCLLGTSLLLPLSPTHAEEPYALDDLLVTASLTPLSSNQTGTSHTIIAAEKIERRQAIHVSDLLRDVPGIAVSRSGGIGGQTDIRMRGAEADQTLILIDGIEANDSSLGSSFDFAHLLTSDIERIEIIRGPQSSLWGSDAIAGVINIITKAAKSGTQLNGSLELGSFSTAHSSVGISDRGENYNISLNGNYVRSDGINASESGNEDDGYKNATLNIKGGFNPWENLQLSFVARHTSADKEFDPTSFVTSKPEDGDRETENEQTYALAKATLDLFDGHWQHIISTTLTDTDNENFADGIKSSTTEGKKLKISYQNNIFFDTSLFTDAAHTVTFARESEKEEIKQTGTASAFGDPNQQQDLTNHAYILEYRVGLWDQLFVSISTRYDDNEEFDNAKTYRGTLAYNIPDSGTTLRTAYGTGVKNPTFGDRFGFTPDQYLGNPNLKPEKSKGWEIGIDQTLFSDNVTFSATLFREELQDAINGFFFDATAGSFTAVNIDGKSKRKGLELAIQTFITDELTISGSYSNIHSTEAGSDRRQTQEIRRPEHLASLNANYRFMDNKANINLGIDYTSSQLDRDFSTFPATIVKLDNYTLVNLTGEYSISKQISLFGRIENLFDENYQDIFGYNTPGIAGYAGVRMNLDL